MSGVNAGYENNHVCMMPPWTGTQREHADAMGRRRTRPLCLGGIGYGQATVSAVLARMPSGQQLASAGSLCEHQRGCLLSTHDDAAQGALIHSEGRPTRMTLGRREHLHFRPASCRWLATQSGDNHLPRNGVYRPCWSGGAPHHRTASAVHALRSRVLDRHQDASTVVSHVGAVPCFADLATGASVKGPYGPNHPGDPNPRTD